MFPIVQKSIKRNIGYSTRDNASNWYVYTTGTCTVPSNLFEIFAYTANSSISLFILTYFSTLSFGLQHLQKKPEAEREKGVTVVWDDQKKMVRFGQLTNIHDELVDQMKAKQLEAASLKDACEEIEACIDDDMCKIRVGGVCRVLSRYIDVDVQRCRETEK